LEKHIPSISYHKGKVRKTEHWSEIQRSLRRRNLLDGPCCCLVDRVQGFEDTCCFVF